MNKKDVETFIETKVEEREVKRSKLYLSNEDIEKEEWELQVLEENLPQQQETDQSAQN